MYKRITLLIFVLFNTNSFAIGTASSLFNEVQAQVYQIRMIDKGSGDKSSIGSGFQISADGYLATNYHVISDLVHDPDKYRLEFVSYENITGAAELVGIDVVHDLAILKITPITQGFFQLNSQLLSNGDRIYSMGNPLDLGMTIIEGNYNGLLENSRYHKILFSGSLNAGMSGGPAFDSRGKVIGVNVSKGPEQLSFLVPAKELKALFEKTLATGKPEDFEQVVQDEILKDQDTFYTALLSEDWQLTELGKLKIPFKISDSLKCWGRTRDKEEYRFKAVQKHCQSQDEIYLHPDHYTGSFSYHFEWITTEELNPFQFYHYLEKRFRHRDLSNAFSKDDISEYECITDFVEISEHSWRASTCVRAYKIYDKLFDAMLILASVDENDKAAIIRSAVSGVSKDNIQKLFKKMMESIQWIP